MGRCQGSLRGFFDLAVLAKDPKILERVVALLASFDLMVDLQVLQRPALLTAPVVPLQNPLHDPVIGPGPRLFRSVLGDSNQEHDGFVSLYWPLSG